MSDIARAYVQRFAQGFREAAPLIRMIHADIERQFAERARRRRAYVYWLASEPWYRHWGMRWRLRK